ncbi:PSP1 C-terminal conserved region-domain-containing protein [Flagelloscypha sp. PMI_526]|nr:PSP1 C-terminal conserved region-domain-containing protein [Flagelloscypha sp. PMI_526]
MTSNEQPRPIHRLIPSSVQSSQRATSQPPRPIGQQAQRQYGISLSPPPIQPGSRSSSFSSYAGLGRRAFSPGRGVEEEVEFLEYDDEDFPSDYGAQQLSNSMNDEQFARGRFLQGGGAGLTSRSQSLMAGGVGIPGRRLSGAGLAYGSHENASPFVRDVGSILLDDASAFRELLSRDERLRAQSGYYAQDVGYQQQVNGTASRRHSVSVIQPHQRPHLGSSHPSRQPSSFTQQHHSPSSPYSRGTTTNGAYPATQVHHRMSGFDAPDAPTPTQMPNTPRGALGGGGQGMVGGLGFNDEDLVDDLASLSSLNLNGPPHHHPSGGGGYETRGMSISPRQRAEYAPLHISTAESQQPSSYGRSPISPGPARSYSSGSAVPPPIQRQPSYPQQFRQQVQPQQLDIPPDNQLGRGIPLATLPPAYRLYIVEFKAGRTDLFYWRPGSGEEDPRLDALVLVEGDRGRDLGKVVNDHITREQVEEWLLHENAPPTSPGGMGNERKEINPKMILGVMGEMRVREDLGRKEEDERKALGLCQQKVRAKRMPMEVVDAEYQWDRKKLTFYFISDKRIDFRELVRELFRLYKTRIWMAALQAPAIPPNLATPDSVHVHAQSLSGDDHAQDHIPGHGQVQQQHEHARNGSGVKA